MYKTISQVRKAFWEAFPQFRSDYRVKKRQNDYCCNIRCCFVDFVDMIHRDGQISDKLSNNVTL